MNKQQLLAAVLGASVAQYYQRVMATNPIAYWALDDASGTTAVDKKALGNGTYNNVTLAQPGIGDGKTSVSSSGTGYIDVYSVALNAAFTPGEMTMAIWMKIATAQWGDATNRFAFNIAADATNNRACIVKASTANSIQGIYAGGGTTDLVTYNAGGTQAFIHACMTVSKAADQLKFFFNGAQVGTTQTGIGTWAGALSNTRCSIASIVGNGAFNPIIGNLAHAAIWNGALTPVEVANVARIA